MAWDRHPRHIPGVRSASLAGLLAVVLLAGPAPAQEGRSWHLIRRVPLAGAVRWDYLAVDTARHRLFITHGTEVLVLDTDSLTVVGRIPDTQGVHGVALAPELGRGYTSDGADSSVTVFDLASLRVLDRLHATGRQPDAIAYDSVARRVFTFNGGSGSATAFEAASGAVAGTIPLGGTPEFAVADGRGRLFVNLEDRDSIVSFDTRTLALVARWPLAPCATPSALALDRARRLLFVGCRNRVLAVVDADRGTVVTTLPIGAGVDALVFDPATRTVLSANGDGTLTVATPDASGTYRVAETVTTARGARTLAFDPRTRRIFLVTAEFAAPGDSAPRQRPQPIPGTFVLLVFAP
jgi:DNA-binding beta-propeller fold protein YncE